MELRVTLCLFHSFLLLRLKLVILKLLFGSKLALKSPVELANHFVLEHDWEVIHPKV